MNDHSYALHRIDHREASLRAPVRYKSADLRDWSVDSSAGELLAPTVDEQR
jgi:hypothetical protein